MDRINRITLFSKLFNFFFILIFVLPCWTAMGKDKNDDEFTLDEITVTAEFKAKELQKTPLSITAISADTLEARNQVSLEQISLEAPNVSLRPGNSGYGSSLVAFIRGIGQTDFNPSVEPGVGIYVDDVYYSTITGNILDLLDLERVEILRGPQGTLAGRNAIGGAIKLFTKKPDGRDGGYVSMTYGSFDRLDIRGAGDFSITDKLFARIAGTSRSRDGYVTSYDYACRNKLPPPGNPGGLPTFMTSGSNSDCELAKEGGQSMTAGRISLRWIPSDSFEVNFASNIVNDKSESQPNVIIKSKNMTGGTIPIFFDNDGDGVYTAGIDIPYDERFATPGTYYNYSTYIDDGRSTPNPTRQGGNPGMDLQLYKPAVIPRINHLSTKDYTLTFDWMLSPEVSLKSISAYREYVNIFGSDSDGSPLSVNHMLQEMDHHQFTQELRLNASLFDGFADATIGAFYLDQTTKWSGRIIINTSAFDFLQGPDVVPATSKAVYGQTIMHLTDRMDLTLGARYSKDEKEYSFQRHNPDGSIIQPATGFPFGAGQPPNNLISTIQGLNVSYSSSKFDYRAALDYSFTDRIMGYVQVATGYRAGGNNSRPYYPTQVNAFDPEELTNYEVGIKSTLFDQLRLNASVFYNDYSDIQLPINTCYFASEGQQTPCAARDNVGDAELKGFEVEGVWRPTDAFSLDFSYSYIDFEYTELRLTTITDDATTPYTPKNKWSAGIQYRFKLGKYGDLTPRFDLSFQDSVFSSTENTAESAIESYYLANGSLTWRSEDLKWQATLDVTNLTDKYYYLTTFDALSRSGYIDGQPGRPREFALTVKRTWYFK